MPIQLTASYDTLLKRVNERDDQYRISNQKDLDNYLNGRGISPVTEELVIQTDDLTAEQVARQIIEYIKALPDVSR